MIFCAISIFWACLKGTEDGYPCKRVTLELIHFLFFLRRVNKAAKVTLAGRLTFSLVNTPSRVNLPTRVNFLIATVSNYPMLQDYFACNPGLSFALQLGLTRLLG